jgi:hypothetical protein
MLRKLCVIAIVAIVVFALGMPVLAGPAEGPGNDGAAAAGGGDSAKASPEEDLYESILRDIIGDKNLEPTSQFLVTITKPDSSDVTHYKRSYVICGNTEQSDIRVILARYDTATDKFTEFKNVDGYSRWDIGKFGLFSREVLLDYGTNVIKIIAYKKAGVSNLKPGVNLQVSYHSINAVRESIKDKIINKMVDMTKFFERIFE